jgi:copper chaperone CopZ
MPGSKLRYFCEDHVPSRCLRSEAKSRAATDASKRWKLSEFVNTRDATLCCDDLEVGEIYKYYCDDHSEIYADKIPKVPVPMSVVVSVAQERLVPPNDELPEDKRWMADIPFDTRQLSIKSTRKQ